MRANGNNGNRGGARRIRIIRDPGLRLVLQKFRTYAELAAIVGAKRQAAHQWKRIPAQHVLAVSRATGIPPRTLRPDIFGKAAP